MSSPSHASDMSITDRDQLVAYIASGEKPRTDWRIGTEHEKFGFRLDDLRPPEFDGERGIESLLRGLTRFGWDRVDEKGQIGRAHSELQSLMRISYAVFCLKKKTPTQDTTKTT